MNKNNKKAEEALVKNNMEINPTANEIVNQSNSPLFIQPLEPESESWSYMGYDSTAIIEITSMEVVGDEDKKEVSMWMDQIKKPIKGQKIQAERLIHEGIELIKGISSDSNRLINEANMNFAKRAVTIGLICIRLKDLIRGSEKPWGVWAEENLPFIAKRNREKYMLLASRSDCWPFSFLGVDRMEILCSATKEIDGENQIGEFLKKYEIPYAEESEMNMSEFKTAIDVAINNERLIKNGLTINLNMITNILNIGVDFDKSMIKRLKEIQEAGGHPEVLLEKLALSGGQEDVFATTEKRLQDFNNLTNKLIKTIDFIIEDQDQLVKIDRETFRMLIEKLISIQDLGILNT